MCGKTEVRRCFQIYADLLYVVGVGDVRFFGDAILKAKQRPIKCCKNFLGQIFG